jgi:hypothetical protein
MGPNTGEFRCDNARVKFDVTDSYDSEEHEPTLSAPSSYDMGAKTSFGSFSGSFDIENTETHPWSDDLEFTVSIGSESDWISSVSPTSDSLGPGGSKSITVNTIDLRKNGGYSGIVKITSDGETKEVTVTIKIKRKLSRPSVLIFELLQSQFPQLFRLIKNISMLLT